MSYQPNEDRYAEMRYNRSGRSGLMLPALSLGLWHNFGGVDTLRNARHMLLHAFDAGITHFDLANNYGPPPGSAEENFGRVMASDLRPYRDELIISTKAGYRMWPGPYGEWGSRKYLLASLDQSLRRMGLDYVDIFYSHRPDPDTPLEETMSALAQAVRAGKALYVGVSSYSPHQTASAASLLREMGVTCTIHQPLYNMLIPDVEYNLFQVLQQEGIGCIAFCPLAQGLLTDRYLHGIPGDSRAARPTGFLNADSVTDAMVQKLHVLNDLAGQRGQTLAQMALAWVLRDARVTSALIGASRVEQIDQNLGALQSAPFTPDELNQIETCLRG